MPTEGLSLNVNVRLPCAHAARTDAALSWRLQGSLRTHMEVSLAHISGGGGGGAGGGLNASLGNPLPPPALSAAGVGAAWRAFKEVCCEESAEARQVAIHWLHKVGRVVDTSPN